MKCKDYIMRDRVAEEIYKLGDTNRAAARKIGCDPHAVSDWLAGKSTPSAYNLKRMHYAGCDIIYILTGERTR